MNTSVTKIIAFSVIAIGAIFVYRQYSEDEFTNHIKKRVIEKVKNQVMGLFSSKTQENFEQPSAPRLNTLDMEELRQTVRDLKKENESLKEYNEQLHNKILEINRKINNSCVEKKSVNQGSGINKSQRLSEISKVKIEAYVEEMLKDKSINIKYLPDFVEEALYRNIFGMLLNLLDHILETSNVELLGHNIKFDLKPPDNAFDEELELHEDENSVDGVIVE